MNFIKKTIKITFIIIVLLLFLFRLGFYTIAEVVPRISMIMASEKYISENYKTATIIKQRYQPEIAFIIPYGTYDITLNQDGYEFEIELSACFFGKPRITDYYGSSDKLDDIKVDKIKNYISNHELFRKYNYDESKISISTKDEEEFVTKEKVDKNTFEIINIKIENESNFEDMFLLNKMESEEKHKFLNDIFYYLKSKNLKFQKLELDFCTSITHIESNDIFSIREHLNICSDEFIQYEKINESNISKENEKITKIFNSIKNIEINDLIIEDVLKDDVYFDINILLKNKGDKEKNIDNDIKILFEYLDNLLEENERNDSIKLVLNYDIHKANEFHYIYYYR